ncbi:hypothetical protein PTKIN_Ptkin03bG0142500 [Pterospermum kingtungense]
MSGSCSSKSRGFLLVGIRSNRSGITWSLSPIGWLKFNVDGSRQGQPSKVGVGGVLRDNGGSILLKFMKGIGVTYSNFAELTVVKEAFRIFFSSQWVSSFKLCIESHSTNIVKWVNNPRLALWRIRCLVGQIENLKMNVSKWSISHILREANDVADGLAKGDANRDDDLLVVF